MEPRIQWEFLGDFGGNAGFSEKSGVGVVLGDLGPRKACAQCTFQNRLVKNPFIAVLVFSVAIFDFLRQHLKKP